MSLRRSPGLRVVALALVVGLPTAAVAVSRDARAQVVDDATRNAARDLAVQGRAAFAKGDFDRARDLFHRAYTLVPAPTIALYEARALVKLGRLVEAVEAHMRTLQTSLDSRSTEQFRAAVREAESELHALRPRIPKLTVVVSGPGAEHPGLVVLLDGVEMNRALLGIETSADPGEHHLVAHAPGGEEVQATVTLAEREAKRVELAVPGAADAPAPAAVAAAPSARVAPTATPTAESPSGSTQKTLGFIAIGVGVAGIGTGVLTGLMAVSRHATAEGDCPDHACVEGSAGADALDGFRSLRTVSTVGYVVGGIGLAGGAALLWFAPRDRRTNAGASVGAWVGVGSAGVRGSF